MNIKAIGAITKKSYCNKCFSIVEWDSADEEITALGNRYVVCPKCGGHVDTKDAVINYDNVIENPGAIVDGVVYESFEDAFTNAKNGATIALGEDLDFSANGLDIEEGRELTLDLNGQDITMGSENVIVKGNLTIEGEGTITGSGKPVYADGGVITLKSGKIKSTGDCALTAVNDGVINIEGGEVEAQEFGVLVTTGAVLNIEGGEIEAFDNAAIGGNGTNGLGGTVMNVKGGKLISNIQSAGYVACGIYAPNEGVVNVTGGEIIANNGAGIVARGGKVNISGGKITATGDTTTTGKVGDSRQVVTCSGVVYDKNSRYPAYESLEIKITNGSITGAKSSIEVLTDEESPKIKVSKSAKLTPAYEG